MTSVSSPPPSTDKLPTVVELQPSYNIPLVLIFSGIPLGFWQLWLGPVLSMLATASGAASLQSLGISVFGLIFVATFLSLFMVLILYILVTYLSESLLGHGMSKEET